MFGASSKSCLFTWKQSSKKSTTTSILSLPYHHFRNDRRENVLQNNCQLHIQRSHNQDSFPPFDGATNFLCQHSRVHSFACRAVHFIVQGAISTDRVHAVIGLDVGRRDYQNVDTVFALFCAKALAVTLESVLGGCIAWSPWDGEESLDAADKNDGSRVPRPHRRENFLGKQDGTEIVGLHHFLLDFRGNLIIEGTDSKSATNHHNVDKSEELERILEMNEFVKHNRNDIFKWFVLFDVHG